MAATPEPMERRSFLVWLAGLSLGAGALLVGTTVARAVMPPARSIEGKTKVGKLAVGRVAELQSEKPVLAEYGDDVLYLVKLPGDQIEVFDAACPHVRCKLAFNESTKRFDCPCHASSFDIHGKRLFGPAPRDMIPAQFQVVDGEIVVSGFVA